MAKQKEDRPDKKLATRAILIGLVLICTPLLLERAILSQPQCALPKHPHINAIGVLIFALVDRIGDACVIAGLIGIVFDEALKLKFIQEVVRAASPKLIGQHLPEPIREALLSYFKINFIRPDWEIEYEITMLDGFPDFVQVSSRIQGFVQNVGSDLEEYTLISTLDPAPKKQGLKQAMITRISMRLESGLGGFDEFPPDNAKLMQPDGTILFKRTFFVGPGERFKTVFEATEYCPVSFVMPLFSGTTVVKATMRIRYPKDLLDIQVSTGSSTNFQPEPTIWGAEWSIPTALLPGQAIVTTWNLKGAGAAATLSPPSPPILIEAQPSSTTIAPSV